MPPELSTVVRGESARWPHIARYLGVRAGWIEDDFPIWCDNRDRMTQADWAAGNEEWADFYEWRFAECAKEMGDDVLKRRLMARWTDSMVYCCRRSAARARGEDPGEWVPQHVRRPDLD